MVVNDPAGASRAPARLVIMIQHSQSAAPCRKSAGLHYIRRRRHSHLCAERQNKAPGGLVTSLWSRPPQAGPARRATTVRRQDRLGRGPGRPVQAYLLARKKGR